MAEAFLGEQRVQTTHVAAAVTLNSRCSTVPRDRTRRRRLIDRDHAGQSLLQQRSRRTARAGAVRQQLQGATNTTRFHADQRRSVSLLRPCRDLGCTHSVDRRVCRDIEICPLYGFIPLVSDFANTSRSDRVVGSDY